MLPTEVLQSRLLERLYALDHEIPDQSFVLIWTYFDKIGLGHTENEVRRLFKHPRNLPAYRPTEPWPGSHEAFLADLAALAGTQYDLLALRWLITLDQRLNGASADRFPDLFWPGLDDNGYKIRKRNNYISSYSVEARQGHSLAAYTPFHKAVPVEPVKGISIDSRAQDNWGETHRAQGNWGETHLHRRLLAERRRLQMMLWPLQTVLDYPALDALRLPEPPKCVRLDQVRNEPALRTEVLQALETAAAKKVTMLILPELAIPSQTEAEIRRVLASHGKNRHPILTLFGCCHSPSGAGGRDVNEAVLLGPDGAVLHRHRKLTNFNDGITVGEDVLTGDVLTVLESPLGNLTPLICLDLINSPLSEIIRLSHANLLAVPSLSPETLAHRNAAKSFQVSNQASTFVCNRWLTRPGSPEEEEKLTSFYQLAKKDGYRSHLPRPKDADFLLFSLSG